MAALTDRALSWVQEQSLRLNTPDCCPVEQMSNSKSTLRYSVEQTVQVPPEINLINRPMEYQSTAHQPQQEFFNAYVI